MIPWNSKGNFAVLIKSGFSIKIALLFNFLSACTGLVGFFIGVSVTTDSEFSVWIFCITAGKNKFIFAPFEIKLKISLILGMFLYISLTELVRARYLF